MRNKIGPINLENDPKNPGAWQVATPIPVPPPVFTRLQKTFHTAGIAFTLSGIVAWGWTNEWRWAITGAAAGIVTSFLSGVAARKPKG